MFMVNNQNDTVKVKMLGGFSISFKDRELTDDQGRTKKVWTLIEYLLANYGTSVSQERLIEAVWPGEEYDNPLNALKTLFCLNEIPMHGTRNYLVKLILSRWNLYINRHPTKAGTSKNALPITKKQLLTISRQSRQSKIQDKIFPKGLPRYMTN